MTPTMIVSMLKFVAEAHVKNARQEEYDDRTDKN